MATKTMEVKEKVTSAAVAEADGRFPERLRQGEIYRSRSTAQRRGIAQDRCLLAGLQLPELLA